VGFNWYPAQVLDVIERQLVDPRGSSAKGFMRDRTLLFVALGGSRVWGFDDSHSDYDLKFVYIEPVEYYLTIADNPGPDTLDWKHKEAGLPEFNFHGWELRKLLRLAHHGSHSAVELCRLPRVWTSDANQLLTVKLTDLIESSWWPQGAFHGWLNVAESNWNKYLRWSPDNPATPILVHPKKYLYVLHALLSASWMVQHRNEFPLFDIVALLTALNDESPARMWPGERRKVEELIANKRDGKLTQSARRLDWFEPYYERTVKDLRSRPGYGDRRNRDRKPFDEFYRRFIASALALQG
jgi:predicted nucleotidyltransferase